MKKKRRPKSHCESEFCDQEGAEELRDRINAYWAERGLNAEAIAHEVSCKNQDEERKRFYDERMRRVYFVVRSTMCNGKPTKILAERAA